MKISERCRQYENKFPLSPSAIRNTNGWTKNKQYSTPDELRKNAKMFWNFGVSKEIIYELACRKDNRSAKILTWDPTPESQKTVDNANRVGNNITHTNKAYDSVNGKIVKFYATEEKGRCYQLDKPKVFYNEIEVETINLKQIVSEQGVDVDIIKLDIEGRWFEMLTEILDLALPVKCILVECEMYINDTDYEFGRLDSIVERYKTAGFKVYTNRVTSGKCVELCFLKN
jgi:FkbM family methyltransferase